MVTILTFIETYWWIWVIGWFVCGVLVLFSQHRRVSSMVSADFDDAFESTFAGVGRLWVLGFITRAFIALLIVSVILNIFDFAYIVYTHH